MLSKRSTVPVMVALVSKAVIIIRYEFNYGTSLLLVDMSVKYAGGGQTENIMLAACSVHF